MRIQGGATGTNVCLAQPVPIFVFSLLRHGSGPHVCSIFSIFLAYTRIQRLCVKQLREQVKCGITNFFQIVSHVSPLLAEKLLLFTAATTLPDWTRSCPK